MKLRFYFYRGAGFSSRLIEWFSAGPFSHVAYEWDETYLLDSRADVVAGVPPGVQFRKIVSEPDPHTIMELEVTLEQWNVFRDSLHRTLGRPYDKPGILGFATGRNWREPDSWFCSEADADSLEVAKVFEPLFAPANKVTPVALALLLSAKGAKKVMTTIKE